MVLKTSIKYILLACAFCCFFSTYIHARAKAYLHSATRPYLKPTTPGPKLKVGGYLRLDTFFDTRQSGGSHDGSGIFLPRPPLYDSNHCDIYNRGRFGMTPSVSSLNLTLLPMDAGNAKIDGYGEIDFVGNYDFTIGMPKLRLAMIQAQWPKVSVLAGLYYHPLTPEGCQPSTVGYHGGVPPASYGRVPQITTTWLNDHISIAGAIHSQYLPLTSDGPLGPDESYTHNSMTPAVSVNLEWRSKQNMACNVLFGMGVDMTRLLPALAVTTTSTVSPKMSATDAEITSFIGTLYSTLNIGDYTVMGQVMFGQNGNYPLLNLGGYAVRCLNPETGLRTYTNTNCLSGWIDFEWHKHKKMMPGFYIGIGKITGSQHPLYIDPTTGSPIFYGVSREADKAFRLCPRIISVFGHIALGFEMDYLKVWYGTMDRCGRHPGACPVSNLRFLAVTQYNF